MAPSKKKVVKPITWVKREEPKTWEANKPPTLENPGTEFAWDSAAASTKLKLDDLTGTTSSSTATIPTLTKKVGKFAWGAAALTKVDDLTGRTSLESPAGESLSKLVKELEKVSSDFVIDDEPQKDAADEGIEERKKETIKKTIFLLVISSLVGAGCGLPIGSVFGVLFKNVILSLIIGSAIGAGVGASAALYVAGRCFACIYPSEDEEEKDGDSEIIDTDGDGNITTEDLSAAGFGFDTSNAMLRAPAVDDDGASTDGEHDF
jgi:hypothetical protein